MKLIILAAGTGSRLKSLTRNNHKTLIKINNKDTIIQRLINQFKKNGIKEKDITIILGHKSEKVKKALSNKINFCYYKYYRETNNLHTLWYTRYVLTNHDTIISFADLVLDEQILNKFLKSKKKSFEALVDNSNVKRGTMKVKIKKNLILKIGKLKIRESDGNFLGVLKLPKRKILKFKKTLKRFVDKSKNNYYTEVLNSLVSEREKLYFHDINKKKWIEIDNVRDYLKAKKIFYKN